MACIQPGEIQLKKKVIYLVRWTFPEKEARVEVVILLFDFYCLGHVPSGVASLVHATLISGLPSCPCTAFVLQLPHILQTRRIHAHSTVPYKHKRNPDISEASPCSRYIPGGEQTEKQTIGEIQTCRASYHAIPCDGCTRRLARHCVESRGASIVRFRSLTGLWSVLRESNSAARGLRNLAEAI